MRHENKAAALEVAHAVHSISSALNKLPAPMQVLRGLPAPEAMKEAIDYAYSITSCLQQLEELTVLLKTMKKEVERIAAAIYISAPELPNATEYVEAKFKAKTTQKGLTRSDDNAQAYDTFCRDILSLINTELIESGAVTLHYVKWGEYLTKKQTEGYDMPDSLKEAFKVYQEIEIKYKELKSIFS